MTINDLLGMTTKSIDVQEQKAAIQNVTRKIPLYSTNFESNNKLGNIDLKISGNLKNIFALYANKDINSFFKKGSIFIVDKDQSPEDGMLVAVNFHNSFETGIRRLRLNGNKKILEPLNLNEKKIILMPNLKNEIIGVVIQVNAKT